MWMRPVRIVLNLQREESSREGAPLDQVIWEGYSEEVTFGLRSEGSKAGRRRIQVWDAGRVKVQEAGQRLESQRAQNWPVVVGKKWAQSRGTFRALCRLWKVSGLCCLWGF